MHSWGDSSCQGCFAVRQLMTRLLTLIALLRIARRISRNLRDPVTRKRVLDTLLKGLGDGRITHDEWEAIGADLGVFAKRG